MGKRKNHYTGFLSSENRNSVFLPKIEATKRVLIISGKGGNDKLESSTEIIAEIFKGYEF
ncbi:hypothetical protein [uncultured Christiangramia sp.]|uniref:hypothetical protein n=1 Tax=Christiangramia sp. 3-2217-3z TaxID=3417564 RepID=UPI002639C517|nr:hypothetical protein [uncultured Christiangramia sp.]